jgi:hypothetical protein
LTLVKNRGIINSIDCDYTAIDSKYDNI